MCVSLYIIETNLQNSDHGLFLAFLYLFWCYFGTFMVLHQPKKKTSLPSLRSSCRRRADVVALWIGGLLGGLEGPQMQGEL